MAPLEIQPSKERLMHLLAEASELEHNLLCSYLFALFSLKESADEGLTDEEFAAVGRWRESLLGVCIEEMTHLAQVANLTVAIGGRPHLNRPNIPVAPGYHPAAVVVEFSRLDLDTLDHFVFLERPDGHPAADAAPYKAARSATRVPHHGTLMPSAPEYETIGAFYNALAKELADYARAYGEVALFSGPIEVQLRPEELHTEGLLVIRTLEDALASIESIVREGEGSPAASNSSHFTMFVGMREEFAELSGARPAFDPSRDVARNPVMHAPVADSRMHVTAPAASSVLDAANAVYGLMLQCLACCFETPWDRTELRAYLVRSCASAMKSLSMLGRALTQLDASGHSTLKAGVSFAMPRHTQGWMREEDALAAMAERASQICEALPRLAMRPELKDGAVAALQGIAKPPKAPLTCTAAA